MLIPLSLILQFVGIFAGAKLLKLNVGLIGIAILTIIPILATNLISGLTGLAVACFVFFVALKVLDKTAGFIEAVGVIVTSMAIQATANSVIEPLVL